MPAGVFVDTNVLLYAISSQPEEKVRQAWCEKYFVPSAGADPRRSRENFSQMPFLQNADFALKD